MTDEAKPSVLSVLQGILSALTGGAISGGGSGGTTTTPVQPTQLLGSLLTTGENYMWPNLLSITVINNTASTGNITLNAVSDAIVVEPGESISWDAAPSSVLSTLTITVPAGTTGRMFGTRFTPV